MKIGTLNAHLLFLMVFQTTTTCGQQHQEEQQQQQQGSPRKQRYRKPDRNWAKREFIRLRKGCEMDCLSRYLPEEAMNCIHECQSPDCYIQVFNINPLEPGEIDIEKGMEFEDCHRAELVHRRYLERINRNK